MTSRPTPSFDPEKFPPLPVTWFTWFMWWCSGAVIDILIRLPTEKNKYVGMGAAIFGTWILATCSGAFAFYTIFQKTLPAVLLGLVYGLFIFNLDRFITSSMRKSGSEIEYMFWYEKAGNFFRSELLPAVPRIIIAVIIGLAVAKPLELQIFRKEIMEQLNIEKENKRAEKEGSLSLAKNNINNLERKIQSVLNENAAAQEKVEALRQEYLGEMDGTRGSRVRGYNAITQAKKREYEKAELDFKTFARQNAALIAAYRQEIDTIKSNMVKEINNFEVEIERSGFLDEVKALSSLIRKEGNRPMYWTNFLITLLIILIEVSPVLVKLISHRGPYDAMLDYVNQSTMIHLERELKTIRYPKSDKMG